jgi:hypothetical protein
MNNPMQMLQMINELKQNPVSFIMKRGLNIPQDITNDPNKIIQHLMNTGQISQEQYNNVIKQAQTMGFKH